MIATVSLDVGSTRVTVSFSELVTQTASSVAATPRGLAATWNVSITSFARMAMRLTVPSKWFTTHAERPATATARGSWPTSMVAETSPAC